MEETGPATVPSKTLASASGPRLHLGDEFGGLQVSLLGEGAMGAAYLASRPILQMPLVIESFQPDADENISQEAHLATRVTSPNVVSVINAGDEAGRPQRATYDRLAAHYDWAIGPLERRLLARLRAETFKALPTGCRLLEVGAGTGLNFAYYPHGSAGVATEPSREMIRRAQARSHPPTVHLVQNSAERLPFPDASFDAACATLVFCSVASPADAFAELRRVVKPGGTIALLEHVRPRGLLGSLFDLLNLFTVPLFEDHFNRRTSDEAQRAGLHIVRVERHAFGIINVIVCENKMSEE